MASLTITVPDAVVPRIQAAFGSPGQPATAAQILAQIKLFVAAKVINAEADTAKQQTQQSVADETKLW